MTEPLSDEAIVARVLDGDREAFGLLVDRYQEELAAYAKYMTGSPDEAADIVQSALVRGYRALHQCRDPRRVKGWLFRIVANQCKTHLARRKRRHLEPLSAAATLPARGDPAAEAEAQELRRRVHAALQRLPVDQREALVLRYVHGMDLAEMAETLSASVGALKMRLLRGREALRRELQGVAI
jgi:RNA polymerase sigma-70 factor (ECF subfamily)